MTKEVLIEIPIAEDRNMEDVAHTMDERITGTDEPQMERQDYQLYGGVNTGACTVEGHEAVTANQRNT
jgi:hypothetical protein